MQNDSDKAANNTNTGNNASCSPSDITAELPNIKKLIAQYTNKNEQDSGSSALQNKNDS